tara:strand:- start:180 stop:401 length:222 start_codon:yes stop_codon:yes gene_type:complete
VGYDERCALSLPTTLLQEQLATFSLFPSKAFYLGVGYIELKSTGIVVMVGANEMIFEIYGGSTTAKRMCSIAK